MAEYGFLKRKRIHYGTTSVHAGHDPSIWPSGDIVTPICTSVVRQEGDNPTTRALEDALRRLADAQSCLVFPSGMTAVTAISYFLSPGDHALLSDELYGGTPKHFMNISARLQMKMTTFDPANWINIERYILPDTKIVFIESPSNPLLQMIDIREVCRRVHAVRSDILVCVDNTFMTSYFQLPLELGADIVMASLTKYYNGHGDVTMGALWTNNKLLYEKLRSIRECLGAVPSPMACAMVHRSLRTLPLRMERQMSNSLEVAKFLERHPRVKKVYHPLLDSHPGRNIARKQSYGHSGMIAFYLDGTLEEVTKFLCLLKVFTLGASLGDAGSLVAMPIKMVDLADKKLTEVAVYNHQLIRMSVGLEEPEDLIQDLIQALEGAFQTEST